MRASLSTVSATIFFTLVAAPACPGQGSNVVLNELMADNVAAISDPAGEFDDWFELHNPTTSTLPLSGMYLTDDVTTPTKWRIPRGFDLAPGAHLLVWADDDGGQGPLHASFELDPGESLHLFDTDGQTRLDRADVGSPVADVSTGRLGDGASLWVSFLDHSAGTGNLATPCGRRRYTALDPTLLPGGLTLAGTPRVGQTPAACADGLPAQAPVALFLGITPAHIPLGFDPSVLLLAPPAFVLATTATDPAGEVKVPLPLPTDPSHVGTSLYLQAFAFAAGGLTGSNAVLTTLRPPSAISFTPALIDNAMSIPLPTSGSCFVGGGGPYYGRHAACILYLTIVADNDPAFADSNGASVLDKTANHIKATANANGTPNFTGGHRAWFDLHLPLAYGIARRNPAIWSRLTQAERDHLDLVMEHVLYTGAIFLQPNSTRSWQIASVQVDMRGGGAGSVPNQSASWHAYMIGAYVYWGGVAAMDGILASYDNATFRARLQAAGLDHIKAYYDDPRIRNLLDGIDQTGTLGGGWSVDPLGVRKTIAEFNTSSLVNSITGFEHRYHRYDPLDTHPRNIVFRWGHEFFAGCQPKSNVGPDVNGRCNGSDFGLVDHQGNLRATIPHEFQGIGMPAEFNTRGAVGGPHNRSSWDYSLWGWNFYAGMYSAVAMLGYFDLTDPQDRLLYDQIKKTTEIIRFIGAHKWRSSAGPASQICTWNHGDAYTQFPGNHWLQDLVENIVVSGARLPDCPAVR